MLQKPKNAEQNNFAQGRVKYSGVASGDDKYNTEVTSYSVPRRARAFSVLAPASSLRA